MKLIPLGQNPPPDIKQDFPPDLRLMVPKLRPRPANSTLESALIRTGGHFRPTQRGELNILGWFVELAQLHLSTASPAEILRKEEEFAALERHLNVRPDPPLPSRNEIQLLAYMIADALRELREFGRAELGPFNYLILVQLPRMLGEAGKPKEWPPFQQYISVGRNGLLREMAMLLKRYASAIACCPGCKVIFVKPRKNAGFCSRKCQNSSYMKAAREELLKRKRKNPATKNGARSRKGGQQHGKKGR